MSNLARAQLWLDRQPPAIEGQQGDKRTFFVACKLVEFGLSEDEVWNLLLHFNDRCQPPWNEVGLRCKLKSAFSRTGPKPDRNFGKGTYASRRSIQAMPRPKQTISEDTERDKAEKRKTWPAWNDLEGNALMDRCVRLADLRRIPVEAIHAAHTVGPLRFGKHHNQEAWFLRSDDARRAQARRMDGGLWQEIGGEKAWSLPGSEGAFLGEEFILPPQKTVLPCETRFLLVEGGPDYLAAFHLWWLTECNPVQWIPLAFLGTGNHFHQPPHRNALRKLSGRVVRIIAHADSAGEAAAKMWAKQLRGVGATVKGVYMSQQGMRTRNGMPVTDLNDVFLCEPSLQNQFFKFVVS